MILNSRLLRFVCVIGLIPLVFCSCPDYLSPQYGVKSLKTSDGKEVYFKSEVRGLNYQSLVLSPNENYCGIPNPKSDYIFEGIGGFIVYYKVENDTLTFYTTSAVTPPKEEGGFPIRVVYNEMEPSDFVDLRKNYQKLGLKELKVEISRDLKCN